MDYTCVKICLTLDLSISSGKYNSSRLNHLPYKTGTTLFNRIQRYYSGEDRSHSLCLDTELQSQSQLSQTISKIYLTYSSRRTTNQALYYTYMSQRQHLHLWSRDTLSGSVGVCRSLEGGGLLWRARQVQTLEQALAGFVRLFGPIAQHQAE